jgi:hypothetical protein
MSSTKAPVYIAAANNANPVSSFKERGIQYLMPGAVDDIPVFIEVVHDPSFGK